MPVENQDFAGTDAPVSRTALLSPDQAKALAEQLLQQAAAAMQRGDRETARSLGHEATVTLSNDPRQLIDPETGKVRDKSWWERNGSTVMDLIALGALVGGGFWLSGLNAAVVSGVDVTGNITGIGLGETGATTGLGAGAMAALPGAVAAPTAGTLAGVGGAAAAAPEAVGGATAAAPAAISGGATVGGVGAGETGAVAGLDAGGTAALPGAVAAPSAAGGADLIAGGSAVAGNTPESTAALVSGTGTGSAGLWGRVIDAGLGVTGSVIAARGVNNAVQAQTDAANRALDLQRDIFNTTRGDYLENRGYTRQQISGLTPYQNLGASTLATLGSMTGHPQQPVTPASNPPPMGVPSSTLASVGAPSASGLPNTTGATTLSNLPAGTPTRTFDNGVSVVSNLPYGVNGLVTMQAPDGSTKQIPPDQVQAYLQRGAQVIQQAVG